MLERLELDKIKEIGNVGKITYKGAECFVVRLNEAFVNPLDPQDGREGVLVGFNNQCTHMGMNLKSFNNDKSHSISQCGWHYTKFDLQKGGLVIMGQATESLPQLKLRIIQANDKKFIEAYGYWDERSVPYGLPYGETKE